MTSIKYFFRISIVVIMLCIFNIKSVFADDKARGYGIVPIPTSVGINQTDTWGFRVNFKVYDIAIDTGHIAFNAKAKFDDGSEAVVGYYTNPSIAHGIPTGRANMAPFCWISGGAELYVTPQTIWNKPKKLLPGDEKRLGFYATRATTCASKNSVNCNHYSWVCYFGNGNSANSDDTSALWKVDKKLTLESTKAGVYISDKHSIDDVPNPANRASGEFYNFWFWMWASNCPTGCPPTPTPPPGPGLVSNMEMARGIRSQDNAMDHRSLIDIDSPVLGRQRIMTCTICDYVDTIGVDYNSSGIQQKTSDEENGGAIVEPGGSSTKWTVCYGDVGCHDPNQATPTPVPTEVCNGNSDIGKTMTYNGKEYRCTKVPNACWHGLGNLEPLWGEGKLNPSMVVWPGGACNWPKQGAPFYSIAASANNKGEGGPGFYERCTGTLEFMSKSPSIPFREFRHNRDVSEIEGGDGTPSVPDIVERYVPCSGCDGINGTGHGECWGSTAYTWVYWMPYDKPHPTLIPGLPTAGPTPTPSFQMIGSLSALNVQRALSVNKRELLNSNTILRNGISENRVELSCSLQEQQYGEIVFDAEIDLVASKSGDFSMRAKSTILDSNQNITINRSVAPDGGFVHRQTVNGEHTSSVFRPLVDSKNLVRMMIRPINRSMKFWYSRDEIERISAAPGITAVPVRKLADHAEGTYIATEYVDLVLGVTGRSESVVSRDGWMVYQKIRSSDNGYRYEFALLCDAPKIINHNHEYD